MVKHVIGGNAKSNSLIISNKFICGIVGVIYVKDAIYVYPINPDTKKSFSDVEYFDEMKETAGCSLVISSKGAKVSGISIGETVYAQPFGTEYIVFYKKGYDSKKPAPKRKSMLSPVIRLTKPVSASDSKPECNSLSTNSILRLNPAFVNNHLNDDTSSYDVTFRYIDGKMWIEIAASGTEFVPSRTAYTEVYSKTLAPVIEDGLTFRINAGGKTKKSIELPIPNGFWRKIGIPSNPRYELPTWWDEKNKRVIVEMPVVSCEICEEPARSTEDTPTVNSSVCPSCAEELGAENGLNKLISMFATLTELVILQSEKIDKLIAAQNKSSDNNESIKKFRTELNKVAKTLNGLDI